MFHRAGIIALRILWQFRRDRRSLALVFVVPVIVMALMTALIRSGSQSLTMAVTGPGVPPGIALTLPAGGPRLREIGAKPPEQAIRDGDVYAVLVVPREGASSAMLLVDGADPGRTAGAEQTARLLRVVLGGGAPVGVALAQPIPTTYLHAGPQFTTTDTLAAALIGLFVILFTYLLSAVGVLRERSQGTLERLRASPATTTETVLGFLGGFLVFGVAQSVIVLGFLVGVLRIHHSGNLALVLLVQTLLVIIGVALGLLFSTVSANELQAVQLIPLIIVPQILMSGVIWPVATLPVVLEQLAYVLPLTYAVDALRGVMIRGAGFDGIALDLAVLCGAALLLLAIGTRALGRQTT
ncbi:MAG: ABC transporter permease [Thermomicrobia bacterium]|nr:ABC transporter permease [Thermomicrobia bacterium]MCA1723912.1 ABC transporter permease [Thermomicrobia bacterium]